MLPARGRRDDQAPRPGRHPGHPAISHQASRRAPRTRSSVSSMPAAAVFSSRCSTLDVPGIGSITGERWSSQASASCDGVASCCCGGLGERAVRPATSSPVASGNHGMKPMPCSVAVVEQRLGVAVGEVEEVLHRDDRRRSAAPPRAASTVDLGEADVPDLALVLQLLELADLVLERAPRRRCGAAGRGRSARGRAGAGSARTAGAGTPGCRPASSSSGPCRVRPALVAITTSSA